MFNKELREKLNQTAKKLSSELELLKGLEFEVDQTQMTIFTGHFKLDVEVNIDRNEPGVTNDLETLMRKRIRASIMATFGDVNADLEEFGLVVEINNVQTQDQS